MVQCELWWSGKAQGDHGAVDAGSCAGLCGLACLCNTSERAEGAESPASLQPGTDESFWLGHPAESRRIRHVSAASMSSKAAWSHLPHAGGCAAFDLAQEMAAHLLPTGQATDIGVHGELGVQAKVAAEFLNGSHGQRPGLLAHLQHSSQSRGIWGKVQDVIQGHLHLTHQKTSTKKDSYIIQG
eukprot:1161835-Pelagomonas_calceolata.AAC.4